MAEAFAAPEIGGDHFRSSAVFLTQSHPKQTQGSDIWAGTSLDQMYAQALRPGHADAVDAVLHREPRPGRRLHLQLLVRLHRHDQLGVAERAAADDPRPARRLRHAVRRRRHRRGSRRRAARRAAASSTGSAAKSRDVRKAARRRRSRRASTATSTTCARSSAASRRSKRATRSGEARELPDAPAGVPDSFAEHMKLMFDLQVLALADRHDARHLVQDRPRRAEPRVPGERIEPAVPPGVAPRRPRRADPGVQQDLQVPRRPAAVLPRQAEEHDGRRRAACSTRR